MERQTSTSYFEAAFRLLAKHGADGVTIANLCEELGVTKGSFYYHFYNMPDFVEALADYWESSFIALMATHTGDPNPLRQMAALLTAAASLSHEAEAALRAWGHSNPVIQAAQERIDTLGEQAVAAIAAQLIQDEESVALLAHQTVALAIGLQHRPKPIDRARYLRALANLAELACGVTATIAAGPEGLSVRFDRPDDVRSRCTQVLHPAEGDD